MLKKYREEIDHLDQEIINLLNERMMISEKVGIYKKENNFPINNQKREREIINRIKDNQNIKYKNQIIRVYESIFHESKKIQWENIKWVW